MYPFNHSFIHSFFYSLMQPYVHPFIRSFIHSSLHPFIHSFSYKLKEWIGTHPRNRPKSRFLAWYSCPAKEVGPSPLFTDEMHVFGTEIYLCWWIILPNWKQFPPTLLILGHNGGANSEHFIENVVQNNLTWKHKIALKFWKNSTYHQPGYMTEWGIDYLTQVLML